VANSGYRRRWRTVRLPAIAAGLNWELKAPGNAYWRIVSITARLVTSAVVANRQVVLIGDDQTNTFYTQGFSSAQAATLTIDYCAHTGGSSILGGTVATGALPHMGLLLMPGYRLRASTALLDVADQWSLVTALVDEIPSSRPYIGDDGITDLNDLGE